MVSRLFHSPEPVPDSGGLSANGVLKLLGQPPFSPLTLLVRESVQNSWDARKVGETTIGFEIHGQRIEGARLQILRALFSPTSLKQLSLLGALLKEESIDAVEIRDFGTVGLNGPTIASDPRTPRRFVNFLRNIGVEKGSDEAGSGGTYGFGKGSYYRLSSAHTIAVHSHTTNAVGTLESRFIIAALGDAFADSSHSFTGRHFFGDKAQHTADPVLGEDADDLAAGLGFGVPKGEAGTAILILGFSPGSSDQAEELSEPIDLELGLQCMAEQLIWQCWPKLVDFGEGPEVRYRVTFEGKDLSIRNWEELPVFENLIAQYVKCRNGIGTKISHKTQRAELGVLATDNYPINGRLGLGHESIIGFDIPTHHIALIRKPHLVVKYHDGPEIPAPDIGWNGVYLVADDDKIDRAFASAEPPSHDDWIYKNVQGIDRNFVKHALSKIEEALRTTYTESVRLADGVEEVSALSGMLGGLLGLTGLASNMEVPPRPPGPPRPSNPKRSTKYDPVAVNIVLKEGKPFSEAIFQMEVLPAGRILTTEIKSAIDAGSVTDDLPGGVDVPAITEWCAEIGTIRFTGTDQVIPSKFFNKRDGLIKVYSPVIEGRATVMQLVAVSK